MWNEVILLASLAILTTANRACMPSGSGKEKSYDVYASWVVEEIICNW